MRRLAFILLLVTGVAHADPVVDGATQAEKSLVALLSSEKLIKARTEAEAILARNPDSFLATWAMALVQHDEEGNHARALYFARRAEHLLVTRHGSDPGWHKKVLGEQYSILHEMDRNLEAIATLDRQDALYGDVDPSRRIWPMFKVGRVEESREIARKLALSDDLNDRISGYNGMLSIEFEARDREGTYRWAVEGVRASQERSCTILRNAAGSAFTRFRLREAEEYALRAHKAERDCTDAGYDQLAGIYIIEGEFQKALSAIESLKNQPIEKRYRPHFALRRRAILVDLLHTLGKVEDSERMAGELYGLPDRTGMTSGTKQMERFSRSSRYHAALGARLLLERERSSYRPLLEDTPSPAAALRRLTQWEIRRGLIQLAADREMLLALVRPNLGEITEWPYWRSGYLIEILGPGVVARAIDEARQRDSGYPEAKAYLDALAGEVAYRQGDLAGAERLAGAALAALAREEALLRWRTQAWRADALWRLGKRAEARAAYHEVLQQFPSALRFLDLRVPASIRHDDSELGRAAAKQLAGSTRFAIMADAPFRLDVSAAGGLVTVCLTDASGGQLGCGTGEKKQYRTDTVLSGLDAFHAAAFSPKVSLKQSDLNSLDGSPVRVNADEVLKGVLGR